MWSIRKAVLLNTDGYMSTMLLLITVLFGLVIVFGFVYGSDPIGL